MLTKPWFWNWCLLGVSSIIYFWHRRDLRLSDNAGLYAALKMAAETGARVQPVFCFDTQILDSLPEGDARVQFIHQAVLRLQAEYSELSASLFCYYGTPLEMWQHLWTEQPGNQVFCNMDYEPYARQRDGAIQRWLRSHGTELRLCKDQVVFDTEEVLSQAGKPYTVFTPYKNAWMARLNAFYLKSYPVERYTALLAQVPGWPVPSLKELGFVDSGLRFAAPALPSESMLQAYASLRDFPAAQGTSQLSVHLRFGTLSIRSLARKALDISPVYLNELIWRDFYAQVLWHFPQVAQGPLKTAYGRIAWRNSEKDFERWKAGQTGYPLVDAGLRQLAATGFMHNRVRMVVASFLCKHLLLDWRWGEAWFAEKLLDFDLASNNGGWQWASGSGCDAAPYFRIFNPAEQLRRFDPQHQYVRQWVPEWSTARYTAPIVDHAFARQRCLDTYKAGLGQ